MPKAPVRLIGHNKGHKRKTAVLTSPPEKNALAEEQAKNKKKKVKVQKRGKGKQTKNRL